MWRFSRGNTNGKEPGNAENHAVPVVRQERRRGGALLYDGVQEFQDSQYQSLRRRGSGPQGLRDGGELSARRPAVHGAERRPAIQIQRGLLIRRELRESAGDRRL